MTSPVNTASTATLTAKPRAKPGLKRHGSLESAGAFMSRPPIASLKTSILLLLAASLLSAAGVFGAINRTAARADLQRQQTALNAHTHASNRAKRKHV